MLALTEEELDEVMREQSVQVFPRKKIKTEYTQVQIDKSHLYLCPKKASDLHLVECRPRLPKKQRNAKNASVESRLRRRNSKRSKKPRALRWLANCRQRAIGSLPKQKLDEPNVLQQR